jgi:hypothetical protein
MPADASCDAAAIILSRVQQFDIVRHELEKPTAPYAKTRSCGQGYESCPQLLVRSEKTLHKLFGEPLH